MSDNIFEAPADGAVAPATQAAQQPTTTPPDGTNPQPASTAVDPKWFIDEKTPGTGDRPEWMPEKFKSVADLAKAYGESEKLVGKTYGAPEQYQLAEELKAAVSQDGLGLLSSVAKDLNFSQETFNGVLKAITMHESALIEKQRQQINEVRNSIGNERLGAVGNFLNSAGLSEQQLNAIKSMTVNSAAFEALEVLMKKVTSVNNSQQPTTGGAAAAVDVTAEINKIYAAPDFRINPAKYQPRLMELYSQKG